MALDPPLMPAKAAAQPDPAIPSDSAFLRPEARAPRPRRSDRTPRRRRAERGQGCWLLTDTTSPAM